MQAARNLKHNKQLWFGLENDLDNKYAQRQFLF